MSATLTAPDPRLLRAAERMYDEDPGLTFGDVAEELGVSLSEAIDLIDALWSSCQPS